MITKEERERDRAICEAATPDWRAGKVETDNIYVPCTHPDAVGPERVLMRANIHFPYEADIRAAAHCRNRLPAYIADAEEMERRIAEIEQLIEDVGPKAQETAGLRFALRILRGQP